MDQLWKILPLILQIIQLGMHLSALLKYRAKLEELADWLETTADKERVEYNKFRSLDPLFYDYYKNLPDYEICGSNIQRSKGEAFYNYGAKTRRRIRNIRGYAPLSKVTINNSFATQAVKETGIARAITHVRERERRDNHILERWSAIVSAPVAVERYQPAIIDNITRSAFRSMKSHARGFNAAGVQLGTSLFRMLN